MLLSPRPAAQLRCGFCQGAGGEEATHALCLAVWWDGVGQALGSCCECQILFTPHNSSERYLHLHRGAKEQGGRHPGGQGQVAGCSHSRASVSPGTRPSPRGQQGAADAWGAQTTAGTHPPRDQKIPDHRERATLLIFLAGPRDPVCLLLPSSLHLCASRPATPNTQHPKPNLGSERKFFPTDALSQAGAHGQRLPADE